MVRAADGHRPTAPAVPAWREPVGPAVSSARTHRAAPFPELRPSWTRGPRSGPSHSRGVDPLTPLASPHLACGFLPPPRYPSPGSKRGHALSPAPQGHVPHVSDGGAGRGSAFSGRFAKMLISPQRAGTKAPEGGAKARGPPTQSPAHQRAARQGGHLLTWQERLKTQCHVAGGARKDPQPAGHQRNIATTSPLGSPRGHVETPVPPGGHCTAAEGAAAPQAATCPSGPHAHPAAPPRKPQGSFPREASSASKNGCETLHASATLNARNKTPQPSLRNVERWHVHVTGHGTPQQ